MLFKGLDSFFPLKRRRKACDVMFDCSINLALLDLHGSPSHPQDSDYSYYRHNLGVHLFPFESRVLENRENIRLLGEDDFMSSSASGLLFDLWVDNPVLLGFGHCSHPLFSPGDFLSFTRKEGFACDFCINDC